MKNKGVVEPSFFALFPKRILIFIRSLKTKFPKKIVKIPVDSNEYLARFVIFSKWIRSSDKTVKPDAFIPHPYEELSVTRHLYPNNLSEEELWAIGQDVANSRNATLYGRADIRTITVRQQNLDVIPKQVVGNPNHANVINWPNDKALQKSIAQKLAAGAQYIPKP